jgi:response regulator RpfG family c-di-GMP phosphodiesterase
MPTAEAIRLRAASGTQFDPDVVAAFVACCERGDPPSHAD